MEIKDRINVFRESKSLSVQAFEKEIGASNGSWGKANTLSEDVLIKIIIKFPELNPNWLLRGIGGMLSGQDDRNSSINEIEALKEENATLKKELERLKTLKLPTKDSKVYNLWMKFMDITSEMQELYKEEKGE